MQVIKRQQELELSSAVGSDHSRHIEQMAKGNLFASEQCFGAEMIFDIAILIIPSLCVSAPFLTATRRPIPYAVLNPPSHPSTPVHRPAPGFPKTRKRARMSAINLFNEKTNS